MGASEWIAVASAGGAALVWLVALSFQIGRRERDISKAMRDADGVAKKARGTLNLLAQWEDLEPKERRRRAIDLLEGGK